MAALASAGTMVYFGGLSQGALDNSTITYTESTNSWSVIAEPRSPAARSGFGFATDPSASTAILFGGLVDPSTGAVVNDTWSFSFSNDGWTRLVTTGPGPSPREDVAFAVGDGIALLYGGENPNASGDGLAIFASTWELNLTTDAWSRVAVNSPGNPGPLAGASLAWDASFGRFVLFGGCYPCSSSVYEFDPVNGTWAGITPAGGAPQGRMLSTWVWDPIQKVDLLFGGVAGSIAYGDSYVFAPSPATWQVVPVPFGPEPRYSAAADFLAVPGNETLLLTGGGTSRVTFDDVWRFSPTANVTVRVANATGNLPIPNAFVRAGSRNPAKTNASGQVEFLNLASNETLINASAPGYAAANATVWPPTGSTIEIFIVLVPVATTTVVVTVVQPPSTPLEGAFVNLSEAGVRIPGSPAQTNANGVASFRLVPSFNVTLSVTHAGYHANQTSAFAAPDTTVSVRVNLTPLLTVRIDAVGLLPFGGIAPLDLAVVHLNTSAFGTTGPNGWLNATTVFEGKARITVGAFGFDPGVANTSLNYTGVLELNFSLRALEFPTISVTVDQGGHGVNAPPIANAAVNLSSDGPVATGPYYMTFLTNSGGVVTASPPPGNFSISAWAPGFASASSGPVYALPGLLYSVTLYLTALPLSLLDIVVLSGTGGHPAIGGANVSINFDRINLTSGGYVGTTFSLLANGHGWANFSNLPGGLVIVTGSASGFYSNSSAVTLTYGETNDRFVLYLPPLPPTPTLPGTRGPGVRLFPAGATSVGVLLLLPLVGLAGAAIYLTMLRNPESSPDVSTPSERTGRRRRAPGPATGTSSAAVDAAPASGPPSR